MRDAIVYVEPSNSVDGGYLRFATVAGRSRWVQVVVNPKRPINQILAMIGHELQHAIEISEAPSVVDEATMAGLYRRIGVKSCGNPARACYETRGAQVTGATIFRELSGRSVPPDPRRLHGQRPARWALGAPPLLQPGRHVLRRGLPPREGHHALIARR